MAPEQESSLNEFVETQVDFDNVNIDLVDSQPYDLEAFLNDIDQMEDLSIVDEVFCKVRSERLDKSEYLKDIQQVNADERSELSSSKYFTSEIEKLQCDEQNTDINLKDLNETIRMELDQLHNQQVNNLLQFESDVQIMSNNFMNGPTDYEYENLIEKLVKMKKEMENEFTELSQYKQDLKVSEGKLRHGQNASGDLLEKSITIFDDSVKDITTLNEKLSKTVQKLTNQFNTTRSQISFLSRHKELENFCLFSN